MKSQQKFKKSFSLEFFPPRTEEGKIKLRDVREQLSTLNPQYISVTFGAGGSTQQGTLDTVLDIQRSGIDAAPHISCVGSSKQDLITLLNIYRDNGVHRLVALRGDIPSGMGASRGELRYANELVAFIRAQTGNHFHIEVAAYPEFHPQAVDASTDLKNFKRKVDAGANGALTQYFYNADAYYAFVDSCDTLGVDIPVIPGIMPITNYKQLARFSDACGAEIPRWLRKRLEGFGDDIESLKAFGVEVTTRLCENLLAQGAPGIHFYTMNQAFPTMQIWKDLKLGA